MVAAQNGDAAAYNCLLHSLAPILKGFVSKKLFGYPAQVDDVVQEILIALHTNRHTYNPNQPFKAWLFAIARHKIIDHLRKHGRTTKFETSFDELETFLSATTNKEVKQREQRKDIEQAMTTLNAKQRTVIHLLKIEGLTAKEVSAKTGLSVAAVKVTAHRAYKQMKGKLTSYE